ncbi:MAG TPA: formate dehydrogenase accessory sulfurtransferase FdhD [Gemmatimonadaceae bacterium]|nr:formate dehydrogenase accessory sulfurtransferase FdhD [Gemmatimonadaceae bacterium]
MAESRIALTNRGNNPPLADWVATRLDDSTTAVEAVRVAEEVPIAIVYNARPYVVLMGTPLDLEDLAVGFSLTEGVVPSASGVGRIDVVRATHGIELQIEIASDDAARLESRSRAMTARTGCGLCGIETIAEAMRLPAALSHTLDVERVALWRAAAQLPARQALNVETNTVHAAGWANALGFLEVVREDVGRHNALDKVLGALARTGMTASDGFIVVTSRASYEMVQKAAVCGVELLAAVSRPTGLAIRVAVETGVTLVGLLRDRTAYVYTGHNRIT